MGQWGGGNERHDKTNFPSPIPQESNQHDSVQLKTICVTSLYRAAITYCLQKSYRFLAPKETQSSTYQFGEPEKVNQLYPWKGEGVAFIFRATETCHPQAWVLNLKNPYMWASKRKLFQYKLAAFSIVTKKIFEIFLLIVEFPSS